MITWMTLLDTLFFMEIFFINPPLTKLLPVCSTHLLLAGGHMLLKDAVLDLRKGRRYGVVFCPPTREGHPSHQSSWWVKRGLDPVLWEVSCASFFPGKLQKKDSDHFDLTHPENHPESLNPPKPNWFASDIKNLWFFFANLRWVAMVRERPPWWVPSLLEVFQAWPPRWKPCTWSRRSEQLSQMVVGGTTP